MIKNITRKQAYGYITAASLAFMAVYLLFSAFRSGMGFPLDDAWIHQTYARNLGTQHRWFYFPGNTTSGSTAPLWTLLLALGYLINIPYFLWTFCLGGVCLIGLGITAYELGGNLIKQNRWMPFLLGLFLVGEWHMVWAALSGMETLALAGLIMGIFLLLSRDVIHWGVVGICLGVSVWLRPDAITLLGPAGLVLVSLPQSWRKKVENALKLAAGISIPLVAYFLFNQMLSGSLMPNTFYAKQSEYAALLSQPWVVRFVQLALQPAVGAGVILLPGWFYLFWKSIKERLWLPLGMFLWWLGYTIIYSSLLPVAYQHGRYEMPAMPVFLFLGSWGSLEYIVKFWRKRYWRVVMKAVPASILIIWLAFIIIGAGAYSDDVGVIQSEMVKTAQWIAKNTPENTLVAAHDIGALGYWGNRSIIDLAGLVSPEVVPFIRDEAKLAQYLDSQHADILMTFPKWYLSLQNGKNIIYQSDDAFTKKETGENMTVYSWRKK
jgi:hypothetical protein